MSVTQGLLALGFRALAHSPDHSPADKETLLRSEAIDVGRPGPALHGFLESVVCDRQPAKIRNGFAEDEFAVQIRAVRRLITAELFCDTLGTVRKFIAILFGPPVFEIALRIELTALIVETVSDFVPDDGTNGPIVQAIVRFGVEKRGLQNSGGKNDFI